MLAKTTTRARSELIGAASSAEVIAVGGGVPVASARNQLATCLGVRRRPDIVMRFGYGPERPRSLRRRWSRSS